MKSLFKYAVSITLLALIAHQLDWTEVSGSLSRLQWWALPASFALIMLNYLLGNIRWWMFLQSHALGYRAGQLLPAYLIGECFNNVLPSATGGDAWRVYRIYREQHGVDIALAPIAMERIIGLLTLLGLAVFAMPWMEISGNVDEILKKTVTGTFLIAIASLALLAGKRSYGIIQRLLLPWSQKRWIAALIRTLNAGHGYVRNFSLMAKVILVSILMQLAFVGAYLVIGLGIGASMSIMNYLILVPVVLIIASIPFTIGGLGIREAAVVTLFTSAGMTQGNAAAIALFFVLLLLLGSLPGLLVFMKIKDHSQIFKRATHAGLED